VKITIVTRPAYEYAEKDRQKITEILALMRKRGLNISERPRWHQKFAVIDERTVWYGNIDLLGFSRQEESIMRLESKGVAAELWQTK
jgi:phosphatidylserine/phosphatidylglycerophosphate/cardiolipin synthase-like enzyme